MNFSRDFFDGTLKSERARSPEYFYRQMLSFYKSASFVVRHTERIVTEAEASLAELGEAIGKEISELMRFNQNICGTEFYLYADRIARRKEILEEIGRVAEKVGIIGDSNTGFAEFYAYLRG
ncbi:MAG: hypothetical protein IJY15_14330, partial [Thermoguttaceae bacterium]|nr:hypothetical protein [Thermoguttaceae bacterium]